VGEVLAANSEGGIEQTKLSCIPFKISGATLPGAGLDERSCRQTALRFSIIEDVNTLVDGCIYCLFLVKIIYFTGSKLKYQLLFEVIWKINQEVRSSSMEVCRSPVSCRCKG